MAKKRRYHLSGPPGMQPPLKKRNFQEVLQQAPASWKKLYGDRRLRQLNLPYDLNPGLEQDQETQSQIVKRAKDNEIEGTEYQGYCQTTDLYHPIEDFPRIVSDPSIKILGPDDLYQYSRNRKTRSRRTAKKKLFQERGIQRLIYLKKDRILDALRLYDPSKAWGIYCKNVLHSSALVESLKYRLPEWKKQKIPALLRDSEFLRVKLGAAKTISDLDPGKSVRESIYPELRQKITGKRSQEPITFKAEELKLSESDLRHKIQAKKISLSLPSDSVVAKKFKITLDADSGSRKIGVFPSTTQALGTISTPVDLETGTNEVPSCPERSVRRALFQENAKEYLPKTTSGLGNSSLEVVPLDKSFTPSNFSTPKKGHCSSAKECPKSCRYQFVRNVVEEDCEDSRSPYLETESYKAVERRDKANFKSGPYQCVYDNPKEYPEVVVLAPNPEKAKARHGRFFTDEKEFWHCLEKLEFRQSVIKNNYMAVDSEGINSFSWNKNHPPQGIPKSKRISVVHFSSPNGVSCEVQCLFDGYSFRGCPIPVPLLELLENPKVLKTGSAISDDLADLNTVFANTGRKFHPSLEVSRLLLFLEPVDRNQLKPNEKPPNGKKAAAEYLDLGFLLADHHEKSLKPCFNPNKRHKFNDFSKNPRLWEPKMFQYNKLDRLLAFGLIDRAVLKLAKKYGFKKKPNKDIGFIRLALFALLGDFKVFGNGSEDISEFIFPPMDLLKGYSPFREWRDHVGYPHPRVILDNLKRLLGERNLPDLPMIFDNEWTEKIEEVCFPVPGLNPAVIIQNFKAIPFPHGCPDCHSYDHLPGACDQEEILLYSCQYPLCGKEDHTMVDCPTLVNQCQVCGLMGHLDTRHQDKDFDILTGWITFKGYATKHRFAGLVFYWEILSKLK